MNKRNSSLRLTFGPLRYQLLAHDDWGKAALSRLRNNLGIINFSGVPDRVLHLLEFPLTPQEREKVYSNYLPERLANIIPADLPGRGWQLTGDETGHVSWCHPGTFHTFWTYKTETPHFLTCYQLPWQPILEDMAIRGGGIIHSGLVILKKRGYLVTAPQGGGKTTTLSRIPLPWKVMGDDAALVWPTGKRSFQASPLPTWSVLIERNEVIAGVSRYKVATSVEIAGVVFVKKADKEKISEINSIEAAQRLYRAFSEHVMVLPSRDPFRKKLFYIACKLAKTVPSWKLELTLEGNFWDLLEDAVSDA